MNSNESKRIRERSSWQMIVASLHNDCLPRLCCRHRQHQK